VTSGPRIVCVGGATVDRLYRAAEPVRLGTSNPVAGTVRFGGVARNVAESLARLGVGAALVTAVGDDAGGRALLAHLSGAGVDASRVRIVAGAATAEYVAVTGPSGDLVVGLACMDVLDGLDPSCLDEALAAGASLVFADCNLPAGTLARLLELRRAGRGPALAVDAVSGPKAARLSGDLRGLDLLFLNEDEARAALRAGPEPGPETLAAALLARGAGAVLLTRGALGAVVADGSRLAVLPAAPVDGIVDVTGAGDALVAATLRGLAAGAPLRDAVRAGLAAAALALEAPGGVRPDLAPALLDAALRRMP
jgi:pseudouridine kinase